MAQDIERQFSVSEAVKGQNIVIFATISPSEVYGSSSKQVDSSLSKNQALIS